VTGDLRVEHFDSKVFPYPQTLRVWLPPGYDDATNAQRTYPVLYLFDAQNMFDRCGSMNGEEWEVDEALTRLIGEGRVEPIVVVGIDAPDDGPKRASEYVAVEDPIDPEKFVPMGERLPAFFETEVFSRVEHTFRVKMDRNDRALGGASSAANATLYLLEAAPRLFGRVLIESLIESPGNGELVRRSAHLTLPPIRAYVGVGGREMDRYRADVEASGLDADAVDRVIVRQSKAVAENLKAAGGDDIVVKFVEDPQASHYEKEWRKRVPAALEFLFPAKK
jgi:enterochelin esterase-like enzyme